jgi:26S proteasome regulatory subunit N1
MQEGKNEDIHVLISNLSDRDPGVKHAALQMIVKQLRASSSAASSLPSTLISLISQKEILLDVYAGLSGECRSVMADILSVISATGDDGDALRYRLEGGGTPLDIWGHQYIKKLASDLIGALGSDTDSSEAECMKVLDEVLPCLFRFNAECDAIDLLMELDILERAIGFIDRDNYERVCVYIKAFFPYIDGREARRKVNRVLYEMHGKMGDKAGQLYALLRERESVEAYIEGEENRAMKMQLAYIAARRGVYYESSDGEIREILSNQRVREFNRYIAQELELSVKESGPVEGKSAAAFLISDRLVNASLGASTLPLQELKKSHKVAAVASSGLLYLWDPCRAMSEMEEDVFSADGYLAVGTLLGISISGTRVHDANDSVLALIRENLSTQSVTQKIALLQSLLTLYAGSCRRDVLDMISPFYTDIDPEVSFFSMFATGAVFCTSADAEILSSMVQVLLERQTSEFANPLSRFALLGISLVYLQAEEKVFDVLDLVKAVEDLGPALSVLMRGMAYAGSGNSSVLHGILKDALEDTSDEEENGLKNIFAILSVAIISLGDDTTGQMGARIIESAMVIDDPHIQIAIPMALAILYASDPKVEVTDTLRRCAHSGDLSVVTSSIAALGLVSAGSNNSRVASSLEQMESFCGKQSSGSALKISQGLLHLGRGTLLLTPMLSGSIDPRAFVGLMGFSFCFIERSFRIIDRFYFLVLLLSLGVRTKYVITLDSSGAIVKTGIRVGTPVDVSGVAGRPKRISGAQTHETPVILQPSEAAEITEQTPLTSLVEDIVVVE